MLFQVLPKRIIIQNNFEYFAKNAQKLQMGTIEISPNLWANSNIRIIACLQHRIKNNI